MLDWSALFSALGLVLIIEGLLPFISPEKTRRFYLMAAQSRNNELRLSGLVALIAGMLTLWLSR